VPNGTAEKENTAVTCSKKKKKSSLAGNHNIRTTIQMQVPRTFCSHI